MKPKILIAGSASYIGSSFNEWLKVIGYNCSVDSIDLRDPEWPKFSFWGYSAILHVAAIVHKKKKVDQSLYYLVNRDLPFHVAKKARSEGVSQFIFLSTMGVYSQSENEICLDTIPEPSNPYSISKFEAEKLIIGLNSSQFSVSIVRPPLVYGKGCLGNYRLLSRFARVFPVVPTLYNERSMLFVDNLSQFLFKLICSGHSGVFFPQNEDYVCTSDLIELIRASHGLTVFRSSIFNSFLKFAAKKNGFFQKLFGDFKYSKNLPGGPDLIGEEIVGDYQTCTFRESVFRSEL